MALEVLVVVVVVVVVVYMVYSGRHKRLGPVGHRSIPVMR